MGCCEGDGIAMFSKFHAAGLCVIPLRRGVPQVQWSNYFDALPSEEDAAAWDSQGHKEYALVCGEVSGVIALDIDTNDNAEFYYNLAGHTPIRKLGSKGFTAFYRYSGERSYTWGGIIELLAGKRLTTIPPSPHRKTGKPYVWMDGAGLLDGAELPAINPDFFVFMDAKFPRQKRNPIALPVDYGSAAVDMRDAAEMLEYVSSDCSRDEWIEIGMALRDEFGDAACALWHNWSSKAASRYNHNAAQAVWRSFGNTGVTIGTMVYRAKQGGWLPRTVEDDGFSVDISYIFDRKPRAADKPVEVKVTGLVGAVADWITETAIRPQPVLSLAAAIAFVGMLKGHRVRGRTNLRTNMLVLSMAPTAAGKEHPQQCIDRLAAACGLSRHLMGRPTSGTGLLTGVAKTGGVALLAIDELGRFMGNISLKNAGGYQREITDYMVEMFSAAGRTFRGRQYANEKQNPQVILEQPHFCCIGSTVPERFSAACNGTEIIDGFLNRWLVFSVPDRPQKQRGVKHGQPPQALVDRVLAWMAANPVESDNYGTPTPKEMTFTPEAWDRLVAFDEAMTKKLDSEPYPMNQLYARAPEHAEKLAMVLCDDDAIGLAEVDAAIMIVEQSNLQIGAFAGTITDSQHEADLLYVLEFIKKYPGVTRRQLTRMTRRLSQKQRSDILGQLIEAGEVTMTEENKAQRFSVAPVPEVSR